MKERVEKQEEEDKKKDAHLMLAAVDTIAKGMQKKAKQSNNNATKLEHKQKQQDTQLLQTINSCPFSVVSGPLFVCCCCVSSFKSFPIICS